MEAFYKHCSESFFSPPNTTSEVLLYLFIKTSFIHFCGCVLFHCRYVFHLVSQLPWGHLPSLTIINTAAYSAVPMTPLLLVLLSSECPSTISPPFFLPQSFLLPWIWVSLFLCISSEFCHIYFPAYIRLDLDLHDFGPYIDRNKLYVFF